MQLREQIRQLVDNLFPFDVVEANQKRKILDWIESGAKLCRIKKPATPTWHLVTYFVPIDLNEEKILLVDHKKANLWVPPGGHVDPGEHPKETVAREMQEELATHAHFISPDPFFLSINHTEPLAHVDVSLWYLVKGDIKKVYLFEKREFHKIAWFSLSKIPTEKVEPNLKRFVDKFVQKMFDRNDAPHST